MADVPDPACELPVLGQAPAERADAARNRELIIGAAQRLVAERGVRGLTMNEAAAAAGVGVGTVYRRFGSLAGLAEAMMDARERRLQRGFVAGPPPLGPGAPAAERIRAFLRAYVDVLDEYAPLMAQGGVSHGGAYVSHRMHLTLLLAEARPGADAEYLAHALLAPLDAAHFLHHRDELGMPIDRIKAALDDLVAALT